MKERDGEVLDAIIEDAMKHGIAKDLAWTVLTERGRTRMVKDQDYPTAVPDDGLKWITQVDDERWRRPYIVASDISWDERVAAIRVLVLGKEIDRKCAECDHAKGDDASARGGEWKELRRSVDFAWKCGTFPSLIVDACGGVFDEASRKVRNVSLKDIRRAVRLVNCSARLTKGYDEGIALESVHRGTINVIKFCGPETGRSRKG